MALPPSSGRSTDSSLWYSGTRSSSFSDLFDQSESALVDTMSELRLRDAFDFRSALDTPAFSSTQDEQVIANTKLKWKETRETHSFTTDVFGVKKEEVKIREVKNGSLQIREERQNKIVREWDQCQLVERSSEKIGRQFRLKKEEVKIQQIDGSLRISGERHKENIQETAQRHRVKRSSGACGRELRVPQNVNAGGKSSELENGGLNVKAPKIKPLDASGLKKKEVALGRVVKPDGQETIPSAGKFKCRAKVPNIKADDACGSDGKGLKKKEVPRGGAAERVYGKQLR